MNDPLPQAIAPPVPAIRVVKGANLGHREARLLAIRARVEAEARAGSRVAQDLLWKRWRCRIIVDPPIRPADRATRACLPLPDALRDIPGE